MIDDSTIEMIRTEFIEKTGLVSQAEGLPRIAGRIFGLLIFDGQAVSFGDLAERLMVSRASISTSIRLLEERSLVRRVTRPGERQDFFELAPDPYATMLRGIQKRNRAVAADIARTIRSLPQDAEAIPRLTAYADFYTSTDAAVGHALRDLGRTGTEKDQTDDA